MAFLCIWFHAAIHSFTRKPPVCSNLSLFSVYHVWLRCILYLLLTLLLLSFHLLGLFGSVVRLSGCSATKRWLCCGWGGICDALDEEEYGGSRYLTREDELDTV